MTVYKMRKTAKENEEIKLLRGFADIPLLFKILHVVRCKSCDEVLTSPRTIKWQEGQRCRWKRMELEGTRVYRNRGPHMREDVDFQSIKGKKVTSGVIVQFVQTSLGDFK